MQAPLGERGVTLSHTLTAWRNAAILLAVPMIRTSGLTKRDGLRVGIVRVDLTVDVNRIDVRPRHGRSVRRGGGVVPAQLHRRSVGAGQAVPVPGIDGVLPPGDHHPRWGAPSAGHGRAVCLGSDLLDRRAADHKNAKRLYDVSGSNSRELFAEWGLRYS